MDSSPFSVRRLAADDLDVVMSAAELFDDPPLSDATRAFLESPGHHLLLAFEAGDPAGFVTGVEMTHPDKGTEMFIYELGVREASRRRGIATALVDALAQIARDRGCYGMWVLTDDDNEAALRTYRRTGGGDPSGHVMVDWTFDR